MGKSSSRPRELMNNGNDDNNSSSKGKRKKTNTAAEGGGDTSEQRRIPLSEVVSDCIERWFHDTLKEARAGDVSMQVLVAQMYYSGYGVPKDDDKGKCWITRASTRRPSVLKVSNKRPGYNASDSDSDELAGGDS